MNPHKRSWILQSVKRFGDYYYMKYNTRQVIELVKQIIDRYDLNRNLDMKDRIYLVSPQFVEEKIAKVMSIPGEIGHTCRLGLLSGARNSLHKGETNLLSNVWLLLSGARNSLHKGETNLLSNVWLLLSGARNSGIGNIH